METPDFIPATLRPQQATVDLVDSIAQRMLSMSSCVHCWIVELSRPVSSWLCHHSLAHKQHHVCVKEI